MTTLNEHIEKVADWMDKGGKKNAPIKVESTRAYLMSLGIKPEKRGGPLKVGTHLVEVVAKPGDGDAPEQLDIEAELEGRMSA